jgi:3-hydroxyisobutyrate dehydrogenase
MGASMCGHLLDAGYDISLTTRTLAKAEPLLARGAKWFRTPRDVAENSDLIFTIVGYPHDVREVILDPETGVLSGCQPGNVIIDMTTSQPSLAIEIAEQAAKREVDSLDAPVSGGDTGARGGTLSIMVGGSNRAIEKVRPCLDLMGKTIVHQGGPGSGQHTKMVNQILIATNMIGVCEALVYGHKAGLDLPTVLQSVGSGAAGSWSLSNLGPRIIDNQFDPGFYVEHFLKDMGIALAECRAMNLSMPGLALAEQLYQAVAAQGHERDGTHALALAIANLSGIDWQNR